jgi:hypothetical protein
MEHTSKELQANNTTGILRNCKLIAYTSQRLAEYISQELQANSKYFSGAARQQQTLLRSCTPVANTSQELHANSTHFSQTAS